jgi:hypothetical protein
MKSKFFFIAMVMMLLPASRALSQNTLLSWSAFGMSFEALTPSNETLNSSVRDVFIGTTKNGNVQVQSGFLAQSIRSRLNSPGGKGTVIPEAYAMSQNYPNPFNPATIIRFNLPTASAVTLRVYNILGEEVAVLVNGEMPPGVYQVNLDAGRMASGMYFCRLQAGRFVETKKMLLIR